MSALFLQVFTASDSYDLPNLSYMMTPETWGERKYYIDVPISDENPILSDSLHTGQL